MKAELVIENAVDASGELASRAPPSAGAPPEPPSVGAPPEPALPPLPADPPEPALPPAVEELPEPALPADEPPAPDDVVPVVLVVLDPVLPPEPPCPVLVVDVLEAFGAKSRVFEQAIEAIATSSAKPRSRELELSKVTSFGS
jgi:hypothetical protein